MSGQHVIVRELKHVLRSPVPGPIGPPGSTGPQGETGAQGDPGQNAYEVAVAGGFVGTEEEWLATLVGPQGPQGIQGESGLDGLFTAASIEEAIEGADATKAVTPVSLQGALGAPLDERFGPWTVALASVDMASPDTAVTLTNIPATFRALRLVATVRTDRAANDADGIYVRFNGDTTEANYEFLAVITTGAAPSGTFVASAAAGLATAATADANRFGELDLTIPNYAGSGIKVATFMASRTPSAASANKQFRTGTIQWLNTAAITSITIQPTIGPNLAAGTTVTLWGLT